MIAEIKPLDQGQLLNFFTDHLNRIHCAKSHIVKSFPAVADMAHFDDIRHAVLETKADVDKQIARMEQIFKLCNCTPSEAPCLGMVALLNEAFVAVKEQVGDPQLRDMAILFYLQNIEGLEATSFQILKLTAERLDNPQISQLLQENYDESREDRALLVWLTEKYLSATK
ncbi:DUF892 family protein [Mucilaginibacter myungsuensis]|uniref:DUF892 family protein n=1 Tax=Mucilaginibacter myungsuensis TaxID=649104 RepID=A0A929L3S8_9SPHI|nr:DUF892 family protein [Mucilaginibacter myungsuensis]MBE9662701.1 DUF892 family protein [Mucilaginibacter myungsuensis]MDN3598121.1 DUF892 family protein [Mucilaginibacter myungsuensis]